MKREQIIDILEKVKFRSDCVTYEKIADEILTLQSEITNDDIKAKADLEFGSDWTNNDIKESWIEGAEWMLNRVK
jgi:hypothetical protein